MLSFCCMLFVSCGPNSISSNASITSSSTQISSVIETTTAGDSSPIITSSPSDESSTFSEGRDSFSGGSIKTY